MKTIRTEDAVGHVLCHDLTQIIPGEYKDARFRKGHIVTEEDIPVLLSMGKENLFVWEKTPGMLHENEAAERLADLCGTEHFVRSAVKEGKIELTADCDGLLKVDTARLKAVNGAGEVMIASRHGNTPVKKGDKILGTRVIPLVIAEDKLTKAEQAAGDPPLFRLMPYRLRCAAIAVTGNEVEKGLIEDKFSPVVQNKLAEYGMETVGVRRVGDDPARLTQAILDFIEQGAELVVCTGGMSVDPDDKTPLGIKNTGADIVSYGAPVLPGAMFLLSYYGENRVPVCGLPGCVMYAKRTIFDLVLPRLAACDPVTADDLAALGEGGLCLNCPVCTYPNCGFGK